MDDRPEDLGWAVRGGLPGRSALHHAPAPAILLNDMRQFVSEEAAADGGLSCELSRGKYNVPPHGVGLRTDGGGGTGGGLIGVDPDVAELAAEARLHEGAGTAVEGLAGRTQGFVDDRRSRDRANCRPGTEALHAQAVGFVLAFGATAAAGALALEVQLRHPHHLFGDAVSLLLEFVSRLVDRQFRLDHSRGRRMDGDAAKFVPKAR